MENQSSEEHTKQPLQYQPYRLWYLIFTPSEKNRIWHYLFPDNFQHVSIAAPCGTSTMFFDPKDSHVDISYCHEPFPVIDLIKQRYPKCSVVAFTYRPNGTKHITNLIPSCVSFVKVIMGYKSKSITPYGLFKSVVKNGGELIYNET